MKKKIKKEVKEEIKEAAPTLPPTSIEEEELAALEHIRNGMLERNLKSVEDVANTITKLKDVISRH